MAATTLTAGFMSIRDNFWPMAIGANPALHVQGYVDSICTAIMMVCVVIILASAARRWMLVLSGKVADVATGSSTASERRRYQRSCRHHGHA